MRADRYSGLHMKKKKNKKSDRRRPRRLSFGEREPAVYARRPDKLCKPLDRWATNKYLYGPGSPPNVLQAPRTNSIL
jgi:hypothetical protein